MLCWFYWDPDRTLFIFPLINRPVVWYGFFFVLGFVIAYFVMIFMFNRVLIKTKNINPSHVSSLSMLLTDRLSWFAILGTIIGARLGEVFFYNWHYYRTHPEEIVKIWNGGLASHGGTIGVLIAVTLYYRYLKKIVPSLPFLQLLDMICVPTAFVSCCIRIGNFFNQEILGTGTSLPWGVIFGHPVDHSLPIPRHPVQLYEALCYLSLFFLLSLLWIKKRNTLPQGFITGLFFIVVFGSRFFLEFLKLPQEAIIDQSFLSMGQYLSIPFIIGGLALLLFSLRSTLHKTEY